MWTTPAVLLPEPDKPVAAHDGHGLYVAKCVPSEPAGEWLWFECTEFGDYIHDHAGPFIREPNVWCHLPKSVSR
jgi:hypothetical protein